MKVKTSEGIQIFREKRKIWVEMLSGEHGNSAANQLINACRDAAFFATVNTLGRNGGAGHHVNGHLLEMFQLGYAVRQSLAVRRLVDGSEDVMSLRRVLSSMKENRHYLTREHVVSYDGCPFDTVAAKAAWEASIDWEAVKRGISSPGEHVLWQHYSDSERRHQAFDRISEGGFSGRTIRDDRIADTVLDKMLAELSSEFIVRVKKFVNKFIAHAAHKVDPENPEFKPTYADIEASLKTLAQIHAFLTGRVLYESSMSLVPVPQFNHLDYLDQPLIPANQMEHARNIWEAKADEIDQWVQEATVFETFYIHPEPA